MKDFFIPIIGQNRKETLLVQYEGFLKNMAENLLLQMRLQRLKYEDRFPSIKEWFDMSPLQLYTATEIFTEYQILDIVNDFCIINSEEKNKIISECNKEDMNYLRINTMFEISLREMADQEFIQNIYIIKKNPFEDYEMEYMTSYLFSNTMHKVQYFDGDILDMLEVCTPTSIFINRTDDMIAFHQKMGKKAQDKAFFFLRYCFDTMNQNEKFEKSINSAIYFTKIHVPSCEIVKIPNPSG